MGFLRGWTEESSFGRWFIEFRQSRRLVLLIVAIALLLDNMLLTTVVPIIPNYLFNIRHRKDNLTIPNDGVSAVNCTPGGPCSDIVISPTPYTFCNTTTNWDVEPRTQTTYSEKSRRDELEDENLEVSILFASKAIMQLIANPFVGPLTHKIGYSIPMFVGFFIMFVSTIIFAFGRDYSILFIARALQGIGSSCSSVSGMGMIAQCYPDDKERGNAMGIALGGLALGVLVGPPFGGFMYEYVGKTLPFLILAMLALGDGLLQLLVLQPGVRKVEEKAPSLKSLMTDPYIVIAAGAITFANMGIAVLEPSLPIWMERTMNASGFQVGLGFLPAAASYLIGTNIFGPVGHKMGRWLASMLGMIIISLCLVSIPFATELEHLIAPMAGLGFAIGMVDSCMMPELGFLVDLRHTNIYGTVYAIGDVAFCLGFALGPVLTGPLIKSVGFGTVLSWVSVISLLYAPLLYFLKNPPAKDLEERQSLMLREKSTVKYTQYKNEEMYEEVYP